jgi:hypothetical protein
MAPALKGKDVCRFHGGLSKGALTNDGKWRLSLSKTIHGQETRARRQVRKLKLKELRALEALMRRFALI